MVKQFRENADDFWYDRDGLPISMRRWAELQNDPKYRHVRSTVVAGRHVSTIWLGIDSHVLSDEHHLIFETMVFKGDAGDEIEYMVRYEREDQAESGHQYIVERLRKDGNLGKIPR